MKTWQMKNECVLRIQIYHVWQLTYIPTFPTSNLCKRIWFKLTYKHRVSKIQHNDLLWKRCFSYTPTVSMCCKYSVVMTICDLVHTEPADLIKLKNLFGLGYLGELLSTFQGEGTDCAELVERDTGASSISASYRLRITFQLIAWISSLIVSQARIFILVPHNPSIVPAWWQGKRGPQASKALLQFCWVACSS